MSSARQIEVKTRCGRQQVSLKCDIKSSLEAHAACLFASLITGDEQ